MPSTNATALQAEIANGADLEDPDEYKGQNVFWVPQDERQRFGTIHGFHARLGNPPSPGS